MSSERNLNQINVYYMSGSAKSILRFFFSAFFVTNKLSTCSELKHIVIFSAAQVPHTAPAVPQITSAKPNFKFWS